MDEFDPYQSPDRNLNSIATLGIPGPNLVQRLAALGFTKRAARIAEGLFDPGDRELAKLLLAGPGEQPDDATFEALIVNYPDHSELLYYCLLKVVSDTRPPTMDEIRRLDVASRSALRAQTANGQWENISTLEETLAQAKSSQLAFELASYFRAAWRVGITTEEGREDRAREALQLIDQLVAIYPQDRYYLARMIAAESANRPHVVVESASAITEFLADHWSLLPADRREGTGTTTLRSLERVKGLPGADQVEARRLAVRKRLQGMVGATAENQ